jgi:gliding motility-associated-like protein
VDFSDASTVQGGTLTGWSWDFGMPDGTATGPDASWTYDDAGEYPVTLIVTTANGCTDTVTVVYIIRPADIKVPNVFSPNNDGNNDAFVIDNIEYFGNELVIINRWGNEVYAVKNYRNQWKAVDNPDGTYYYVLRLDDGREFTGHVTVLR